jgi:hypothetical protein
VQWEALDKGLPSVVAVLCRVGRRCSAKTVLLAIVISALGGGWGLAQDQSGRKVFGDARDCPPGHRIEFVLPATTIYVDPHWLGSMTIGDLKDRGGPTCPTGPVKVESVEFSKKILDALDLHHGIGTRLFRMGVGGDPNDPRTLTQPYRESDLQPQHSAPWIEDETIKPMATSSPDLRGYRLYYPTPQGVANRPLRIGCGGGGAVLRTCGKNAIAGRDTPFDGVHYGYEVSQTNVPVPNVSATYSIEPASEPGALLEFDARFRAWFLTLRQRP